MIESPLLGPNEEEYKKTNRQMPKAYAQWSNAEIQSDHAADMCANIERLVSPLSKVTNRTALDNVWRQIRLVRTCSADRPHFVTFHLELHHPMQQGTRRPMAVNRSSETGRILGLLSCSP